MFLLFHAIPGVLKARILNWFANPVSNGSHFVRTLTMTRLFWVVLQGMAHSFIELYKAVVHVIRLVRLIIQQMLAT